MKFRSKIMIVTLALVLTQGSIQASANSSSPEKVTLEELADLGIDTEVEFSEDWRIEVNEEGAATIVVGPGTSDQKLNDDTTQFAGTEPAENRRMALSAAKASWTCVVTGVPKPELSGSQLQSYAGAYCTGGRPGQLRLQHWFERDSWSGWRAFTNVRYTAWTTAQTQGTNIYAQCIKAGGTYNYRAKVGIQINGVGYVSTPAAASPKERWTCGTGVS